MNTKSVRKLFLASLALAVSFASLFVSIAPAQAEAFRGYEALHVLTTGNGNLFMTPGETRQVTVAFLNIGEESWNRDGARYVSVYTREPNYRNSVFENDGWYGKSQPGKIVEELVNPGQNANVTFPLKAPSTPGTYKEVFQLAAEDRAWIPGGRFVLTITVGDEPVAPLPVATPQANNEPVAEPVSAPAPDTSGLSATLLLMSSKNVVARGGETVNFKVGIKNSGTKAWHNREIRTSDVALASLAEETYHSSWESNNLLAVKDDGIVNPGALDFIDFKFSAPRTAGLHTVKYKMAVDGVTVPNFEINIPVEVTSNAPNAVNSPLRDGAGTVKTVEMIEEPTVRVAFLIVDEETDWEVSISCAVPWKLRDENGALLGEMGPNQPVRAFYKDGKYHYDKGLGLEVSSFPLRFIPDTKNEICRVDNFDRRLTRNAAYADNDFRNILELRYNSAKDRTWVINELPIEMYLRGLAETSNVSHIEYQKALITAARTYAFYHWQRATKHADEGFTLVSYADDQVYNGYGQEKRAPKITQAVQATEGVIVTYEGDVAITPYFSRSDGRTRAWSEVWGGSVPWLEQSVPCPCDERKGYALWGHGVGMSAHEALCMAEEGGQDWESILHYFYKDIDLSKKWTAGS